MKKIILTIAICLIVIGVGLLTGLYIIGEIIIDEAIDMSIPTIAAQSKIETNMVGEDDKIAISEQTTQMKKATNTATDDKTAKSNNPAISVEKIKEIKDKVTAQDKVSVAAMVMSRLSSGEVNQLKSMIADGVTAEEKAEAKSIALANFSSNEIKEIKQIYKKYLNK